MTKLTQLDARYMQAALLCADQAVNPAPNPYVGAVVVRDGKVVGRGYHVCAGAPHAEVLALRQAGKRAKGATLYVTLEPCTHHGRTPPCAEAIAKAGINRVVLGLRDPTKLAGGGAKWLKKNGVKVKTGVLASECRAQNQMWLKNVKQKLPYLTLKLAVDSSGSTIPKLGKKWITGVAARKRVQQQRAAHAAVLVGVGTVVADNPRLTVRASSVQPVRIILDPTGRTPRTARLLEEMGETLIITKKPVRVKGAHNLAVPAFQLKTILKKLYARGITSIYVEGGLTTAEHFLKAKLVDRLCIFSTSNKRLPKLWGKAKQKERVGKDTLWSGVITNY